MKRTQVHLTLEQDRRLAQLAAERGISRAGALRWALASALETGDAEAQAQEVILATAGVLADYPDWPGVAARGPRSDSSGAPGRPR